MAMKWKVFHLVVFTYIRNHSVKLYIFQRSMMGNTSFVKADTIGQFIPGPVKLVGVVWTGPSSMGDTCIIKERNGEELWAAESSGNRRYFSYHWSNGGIYIKEGVEVQALDVGKVFLYFGVL